MKKSSKLMKAVCLVLSLVMVLGLAACGEKKEETTEVTGYKGYVGASGTTSTEVVSAKDTVRFRINADLKTLDPHMTSGTGNEKIVQYQFYESLFMIERFDGVSEVNPCLAESYEYKDAEKKQMILHIRKGVKFHDGSELTADDVVYSLERSLAGGYNSSGQGYIDEIIKVDDYTVQLNLVTNYSGITRVLATASFMIVSKAYCEANPDAMDRNPMGTGAFVFDEWITGDKITMHAFPDYWRGEAAIKKAEMVIIPDDSAYLIALENGEVDTSNALASSDVEYVKSNENLGYDKAASGGGGRSILFNCQDEVFKDVRMRQAVILATNREDIFYGAYDGQGYIPYCLLGNILPEVPSEDEWTPLGYDVEKAKALVKECYPNGVTITVPTIDSNIYTKPTVILQQALAEIGINIEIETMARAAWNEKVMTNTDYGMTFWAMVADFDEIDALLYRFHSSRLNGKGNFFNYSNARVDELLDKGRATEDMTERKAIYKEILENLRDDAVFYNCQGGAREVAYNTKLMGMKAVTGQQYYLYDLWWAE